MPRIFVNLSMVPSGSTAEHERLLLMAGKLYRFTHMLLGIAVALGAWLWLGYGIGQGAGWMHAKLVLVVAAFGYHLTCGRLLRAFGRGEVPHTHRWFRVFNEVSVLLFAAIVVLVVVKPF
jgi:protoporphyrinogen IX oxidase